MSLGEAWEALAKSLNPVQIPLKTIPTEDKNISNCPTLFLSEQDPGLRVSLPLILIRTQ